MKIICIGRNYIDHAKELNNPVPAEPIFFLKPESSQLRSNKPFFYPDFSKDIHYEVELIVKISKLGKSIQKKFAPLYYQEIGLGIDFTARDLQDNCKKKGLPWEIAKAFDYSAVVGKFLPLTQIGNAAGICFSLKKNGQTVQEGHSSDMIFDFDTLIEYVSRFFTLKTGDMIYTGTPAGVGPVVIGDHLEGYIGEEKMFSFYIR